MSFRACTREHNLKTKTRKLRAAIDNMRAVSRTGREVDENALDGDERGRLRRLPKMRQRGAFIEKNGQRDISKLVAVRMVGLAQYQIGAAADQQR